MGGVFSDNYFIRYSTGSPEDRYQDKHQVEISSYKDDLITGNTVFPAMENFSDDILGNNIGMKWLRYPDPNDLLIVNATAGKIYGGSQNDFHLSIYVPFPVWLYDHSVIHSDWGLDSMITFDSKTTFPPYYISICMEDYYEESPSMDWTYHCMTYCHTYDYDNNVAYDFQCEIRIDGNR